MNAWLAAVAAVSTVGFLSALCLAGLFYVAHQDAERRLVEEQAEHWVTRRTLRETSAAKQQAEEDTALALTPAVDEIDEPQATEDQVDAAISWCFENERRIR